MPQDNKDKFSQDSVNLREAGMGDYARCATCTSYRGDRKCEDVQGEVDPDEICDIFTPVDPTSTVGSERSE